MANSSDQPKTGVFITFEGGEGAGKSSQIDRLRKYLKKRGNTVLVTREPGGSPGAEAVRHVLLSGAAEPLGPEMETILFFAARSDNVETIIKPALKEGQVVICDRFYDSTRVYQGTVGKVSMEFIDRLIEVTCEDAKPDLTIILDIDPEIGLERITNRDDGKADRFEKDDLHLHQARREAFLQIARNEPERCVVIDGSQDEEIVHGMIEVAIADRLPQLIATSEKPVKGKSASKVSKGKGKQGMAG